MIELETLNTSIHDDEGSTPAEYEYSSMILLTFDVDSYLISRNFGDCVVYWNPHDTTTTIPSNSLESKWEY